ncbi:MAG: diaminobutyrate acetyltransferase [Burkholderiaceae bacterium]|nr:diaminobutyrate acetyltransferase [Burkholderiaceae bacterium]
MSEPKPCDGADLECLVRSCGALDNNSTYTYLLLCRHFSRTCVVAKKRGELAGFLSAYMEPDVDDTLFVWQAAVPEKFRRQGIGGAMLRHLLERRHLRHVRYLEATVAPTNHASRKLFSGFAEDIGARCEIRIEFAKSMFHGQAHEDEYLFRIGPFQMESSDESESRHFQSHGIERPLLHPVVSSGIYPLARRPDLG